MARFAPLDSRRHGAYIEHPDYSSNDAPPTPGRTVPIALPPPQVLEITGADAIAFAHAQFASDVRALADRQWQWSAWLSAQGRVRAFFRVVRIGDERLLLILQGGAAETLRAGLAPFVFRAKVQLRAVASWHAIGFERLGDVFDYLGAVPGASDVVVAGDHLGTALPGLQPRWYVLGETQLPATIDASPAALNRWNAADVAAGIVEVGDPQADRFLPSWLGLDELGAVSVRKGCYPGQEIVARLHFKGGNKRWLQQLAFSADAMPEAGTSLAADHDAGAGGELLRAAWTQTGQGLALAALPKLPVGTALIAPDMPGASFRVVSTIGSPSD
jgi:folate-binding protein YgfZ